VKKEGNDFLRLGGDHGLLVLGNGGVGGGGAGHGVKANGGLEEEEEEKQNPLNPKKREEFGGLPECHLVHPVSLNSKLATVAMGETGPDENAW